MKIQRKFIIGSEWLYLKIYTGVKTADTILEEAIAPLIEYFQENNYISKWFFIRYNDPMPHLRLRFKLNNTQDYNEIFDKISNTLQEYVDSGEISTILGDIYQREIERYGENTMIDAESLFCINSEFTLQCLHYDDEEKIIIIIFYIDKLLSKLNLSIQEKLNWIKNFNDAFKTEFKADKKLNSQLDKKYRTFKPEYFNFITSDDFLEERNAIISNIKEGNLSFQNIIYYNENQFLQRFFQSIFHMNVNRLFISNQRLFEMVIYDYILRYYKTVAFKGS